MVVQDARVFKAGNSLAVRIPSAIAKHCELTDGEPVEMTADDRTIYIRKPVSHELDDLIARITPENVHEPMFEDLTGRERW